MSNQPTISENIRSYAGLATLGWITFVVGVVAVGVALQAGVSRGVSWCMFGGFTVVCVALWTSASRIDHVEHHPDPFRADVAPYGFGRAATVVAD